MTEQSEMPLSERLILIEFWAEWCKPCKLLEPLIDEIADEYKNRVIVWKVNAEKNRDLTSLYGVNNIPTIVYTLGGKMVDKQVGSPTKEQLKEKIESLI